MNRYTRKTLNSKISHSDVFIKFMTELKTNNLFKSSQSLQTRRSNNNHHKLSSLNSKNEMFGLVSVEAPTQD